MTGGWENDAWLERARRCIGTLCHDRIGGNCWGVGEPPSLTPGTRAVLVVVPQKAIALSTMTEAVQRERGADKVLAIMPATGFWRGRRLVRTIKELGWTLVAPDVDPWRLLPMVHTVYTAGDEIGFLALLDRLRVKCFGPSFYTGWGLTVDAASIPQADRLRTLEEVFAASCLIGTRYVNPLSGASCEIEELCAVLADMRKSERANRAIAVCVGISFWKRQRISDMLRSAHGSPRFVRNSAQAVEIARRRGAGVAVWASREPAGLAAAARQAGVPLHRLEDGFLRSVGLGANFTPAASIVVDGDGIYFDPARPSHLDHILNDTVFDPATLERAGRLIGLLVNRGITKYNVGGSLPPLGIPAGARTIFVPGQVENDRSVVLGGAGIRCNLDLLRRVRAENPDAFILYKPHPDVEAGHRPGAIAAKELFPLADRIVGNVSAAAILEAVDEVHTLTSLAGFEALLRGKSVVVHGQPFYAGWGLTDDRASVPHRTRTLSLEQLVAGALILYPRYLDPATRLPCGPELVIDRLSHAEYWRPGVLVRARQLQAAFTRMRHALAGPALATWVPRLAAWGRR